MKTFKKILTFTVLGAVLGFFCYKIVKLFKEEDIETPELDPFEERQYIELENRGEFKDL